VEGKDGLVLRAPGAPATFADRVMRFLKAEARRDYENSVAVHCDRLGVEARRVTIKDTRSRWGSCTSDGRLAFSWRLILAPVPVLDYVAAHECAHLIEMNHSDRFWALVRKTYGDHRPARRWLKQHGAGLHAFGVAGASGTTSDTASGRVPAASF
jgi:predicted metal-dependent hydrolase